MKRSGHIILLKTGILLMLLQGCSGKFVEDPLDPRLPMYTESGNDVAGALLNDEVWSSIRSSSLFSPLPNDREIEINSFTANDSLTFILSGKVNSTEVYIEFHLSGESIAEFDELTDLHGRKILLDGQENKAKVRYMRSGVPVYDLGSGQIYFRNVRFYLVENDPTVNIIISGTFGFTAQNNMGEFINVFYGRFDHSITNEDFSIN